MPHISSPRSQKPADADSPRTPAVNGLQLADDLAAAGYRDVVVVLDPDTDELRVAAKTDSGAEIREQFRSKVEAVVAAHQPTSPPTPDEELAAAMAAASTLEDLKKALLGNLGGAAAVAARPTG